MEGFGSSFNKVKIDAEMSERDLHFNDLRQTAATKFYIAGFTMREIAETLALKEESVEIIRRYVDHHQGADQEVGGQRKNEQIRQNCLAELGLSTGAGEGNRTLVCSLGSCRSAIELRPRPFPLISRDCVRRQARFERASPF
jgi:hypothetical protein